jgi:hypothetical protein
MLHLGGDEDEASGLDRPVLAGDADGAAPADHVVDLVLVMWALQVGRAGGPDREADAQIVRREEVDVAVALVVARLGIEIRDLVRVHGSLG